MSIDHYTYRVTWSAEDNEHIGLCAEFPSLSWLARKPEAALAGIRRVVAQTLADMRANGEAIPEPLPTSPGADKSGCAFRRSCTASWPCRPPSKA